MDACLEAKMAMLHGVISMQDLINFWWLRLRMLDPSLIPWKPGRCITDTNPQVLDPDHPIRKCITRLEEKHVTWTASLLMLRMGNSVSQSDTPDLPKLTGG